MGRVDECSGPPGPGGLTRLRDHGYAAALVTQLSRQRVAALPLALPAALLVVLGWTHRWVSDDGFINFRVADHLLHGNGPVFNEGERVEVYTSPLWIALLAVGDGILWFAEVEWISVVAGLALSALGLLAATFAAARLASDAGGGSPALPLGALVVVALPPFWDYATSGLETGLSLAWLGVAFWVVVGVHHEVVTGAEVSERRFPAAAVVVGLGPLVRPDLALFALGFLGVLVALRWPAGRRRVLTLVAAAAAIPVAYQLFRMAYFGSLVPNTAFAKEAGRAWWDQGWDYLENLADAYLLALPVALLVILCGVEVVRAARRGQVATALAFGLPTLCGLLHALYVVRVGGDFMHGRLLLPSLFGALLPVAAVAPRSWRLYALPVAAVAVWAVVVGLTTNPPAGFVEVKPNEFQFTSPIVDERRWYSGVAQVEHPVDVDDYERFVWVRHGRELRARAERGQPTVALYEAIVPGWRPAVDADVVTGIGNIGMLGVAAGRDVHVADVGALADPIASRVELGDERGRPGHEKQLDQAFFLARFVDLQTYGDAPFGSPASHPRDIDAAQETLRCGDIRRLLEATNDSLSVGRMLDNIGVAVSTLRFRMPAKPVEAREELC